MARHGVSEVHRPRRLERNLVSQTTPSNPEIEVVERTTQQHIRYFEETDSRCRGMQLPDGLMLRFNLAGTLYFYLRTGVGDGKITSRVFASDSPYEREKAFIGAVATPMFAELADYEHLRKVEKLVRSWVEFVTSSADPERPFSTFEMGGRSE